MSREYAVRYVKLATVSRLFYTNIWGYLGVLQSAAILSSKTTLQYVATPIVVWRSSNSHLQGRDIKKMCDMFHVIRNLKVDRETKSIALNLARRHFQYASSLQFFYANANFIDSFRLIHKSPVLNTIKLPFHFFLICYRKTKRRLGRFMQRV